MLTARDSNRPPGKDELQGQASTTEEERPGEPPPPPPQRRSTPLPEEQRAAWPPLKTRQLQITSLLMFEATHETFVFLFRVEKCSVMEVSPSQDHGPQGGSPESESKLSESTDSLNL